MSEEEIADAYAALTRAADLEAAVKKLSSKCLRELNGWLAREGCMSGVPGWVQGQILVEAADRFMKMSNAKAQRTPRGAEIEGGPVS